MLQKHKLVSLVAVLVAVCFTPFGQAAAEDATEDPFYKFNYQVFKFNEFMDRNFAKPVAKGYDRTVHDVVKAHVRAFFNNMAEPGDIVNSLLQGEGRQASQLTGRFILNSTFGFAGFRDVATGQKFGDIDEDFGLTLAKWGVSSGPYIVLPVFGPSNIRDGAGRIPDYFLSPTTYIENDGGKIFSAALNGIDTRARYLGLEKVIIGDRYTFFRDAWIAQRHLQVTGEEQDDDFILEEGEGWDDSEGW